MEAKEVNGMGILRQPLYQQVEKVIEEGILRGEWKAGEALPSEAALAGRYGVSICTVRRALDELAQRHRVERRHGVGTFVQSYVEHGYWNRFQRYQSEDGFLQTWEDEFVSCERHVPTPDVMHALQIAENCDPLPFRLERRMYRGGKLSGTDVVWLHPTLFPTFSKAKFLKRRKGSLYEYYELAYGVVLTDVRDRITVRKVDEDRAARYGLPLGEPLLVLKRTGYTFGFQPVEYRIENVLTENLQIVLD